MTVGATAKCPDANLALGLMRVIRSETSGRFATLDLDFERNSLNPAVWDIVSRVFGRVFGYQLPCLGQEMEFAERNGRIEVPRLLAEEEKDGFVDQETGNPVIKPQLFSQDTHLLKLKLSRPGVLDDIYFENAEYLNDNIGDSEVEIAVEAAGMNFKGKHTTTNRPWSPCTDMWFIQM